MQTTGTKIERYQPVLQEFHFTQQVSVTSGVLLQNVLHVIRPKGLFEFPLGHHEKNLLKLEV